MADPGAMSLLDMMNDQAQPPPENPAVLQYIEGMRSQFQPNYGEAFGTGLHPYIQAAMQPGQSGYFDYDPARGGIAPHQFAPQQVAQQAGESLGALAGDVFPADRGYGIRYGGQPAPAGTPQTYNSGGGFFSLQDLFGGARRDVPSIATADATGLSTNNWRLLGRGPGWIMRNGRLINTRDPSGWRGAQAGAETGPGGPAEGASPIGSYSNVGSGAWAGMPNTWRGATGWPGQDAPYNYDRWPVGNV